MRYLILQFFGALIVFMCQSPAFGEEVNSKLSASQLLFPETRNWQELARFPHPHPNWLHQERWKLRSVYLKSRHRGLMEDPDCSFITRALYVHRGANRFYSLDIDADGSPDVIYSGPAECREGDTTVIWYGAGRSVADREPTILPFATLKVLPAARPKLSSVRRGCCGDLLDHYSLGHLDAPFALGTLVVHKSLFCPEELLTEPETFTAERELVLRSTPNTDDHYDESESRLMAHAVFGNVLSKYLPGARGTVLAKVTDAKGQKWALIVVDGSNDPLAYHRPYNVNVGWVKL